VPGLIVWFATPVGSSVRWEYGNNQKDENECAGLVHGEGLSAEEITTSWQVIL
jgi:hypothetical protein